jgi:hypothetical protein
LVRKFNGFDDFNTTKKGGIITLQIGSDYIEIVTGDELRIDCVELIAAFEKVHEKP